jgi:lysophospholipase L1-like esterase
MLPSSSIGRSFALACGLMAAAQAFAAPPHPLENEIRAFEARDAKSLLPAEPILFVGSSSIVLWDLPKSFPGLRVLNRGFGGSRVGDSVHFFDRIVKKYKPKIIVFYAGDNDLAEGKLTPEQVFADFKAFVGKIHTELPKTRLVFISIKPSIERWGLIDSIRKTNRLIEDFCKADPLITFVNVEPAMLGPDGKPRRELFSDGLHLSDKGYEAWTNLVAPHLK